MTTAVRVFACGLSLASGGCSLIVNGDEAGGQEDAATECLADPRVGFVELADTVPFGQGTKNLVGRRRFVVAGGWGLVVTPDGRVLKVDLGDPYSPQIPNDTSLGVRELSATFIEVAGNAAYVLGDRVSDGDLAMVEAPVDGGRSMEWPLPDLVRSGLSLSIGGSCVFAASSFSSPYVLEVGSGDAPTVDNELAGDLVLARSGLGLTSIRIVRIARDPASCRLEQVDIFGTEGALVEASSDTLWLVVPSGLSAVGTDGATSYQLAIDREIVDARWLGERLVVATRRDLLVYRQRAVGAAAEPLATIAVDHRVIGVAPIFENDDRWLAVLVALEPIETSASMAVITVDLRLECP